MRLAFQTFRGEIPALNPRLLPESYAQTAINCEFASGSLEPLRGDSQVVTQSGIVDFYNHKGTFLTFDVETSVAPGPVATERLYIMAEGRIPRMRLMPEGTEYFLPLTFPTNPPITNIQTPATENEPVYLLDDQDNPVLDDAGNPTVLVEGAPLPQETVVFVRTYVSIFGEESIPSPPSAPLTVTEGSTISLTMIEDPGVGSRIDKQRIYKAVTTTSGVTDYFFVQELGANDDLWVYDPALHPTGEVLPSTFYDPPVSGLMGLTAMNNGMMAAFKGKDLYFCEPFQPHAWPEAYALKIDTPIVGLVAFGEALAILTEGQPHIANGTAPENMILQRMEINAPCLSSASIVDMGYSAFYATHDGIASISTNGASIVSKPLFTREQWRAMIPSSISAGHYDGAYVFSYANGTKSGMVSLGDQPTFTKTDVAAEIMRHDTTSGDLYYSDATGVREFDVPGLARRSLTWRSKIYDLLSLVPFAAILVEGQALGDNDTDTGFAARVYRDGVLFHTITQMNRPLRLPRGLGRRWELEIVGKVRVTRAIMAGSIEEMMS